MILYHCHYYLIIGTIMITEGNLDNGNVEFNLDSRERFTDLDMLNYLTVVWV
jgi:hypothetical protein